MNLMNYRGYDARIEYDAEDHIFTGRLAGITDIVVFHGETVDELETAFHEIVDHYLAVSHKTGHAVQQPHAEDLMLQIPPNLYKDISNAAATAGKNINE